jgi:threonine aldolase
VHFSQARALSITQATEVGTVYGCDQIAALAELAVEHQVHFHMDGARFANAVASLGVAPKELTWRVGVKVLSLGGTKNGMPVGDVVVFFDRDLGSEFGYRRKQAGQLASKMRFLTAPWCGVLESGAYLNHARHANQMAKRLRSKLAEIKGVKLLFATEANSVFVDMDARLREGLRGRGWKFYALMGDNVCRLMCAWDTTPDDVDLLCQHVREIVL